MNNLAGAGHSDIKDPTPRNKNKIQYKSLHLDVYIQNTVVSFIKYLVWRL